MGIAIKLLALTGLLFVFILTFGIYLDFKNFDQTRGGYEPPYTGVTGNPVNWDKLDLTPTGFAKRGFIINVLINGTTGMISFEIFKHKFDWRVFSERALIVHKPREAFIRHGFSPQF